MSDETIQFAISAGVFAVSLLSVVIGIVQFVSFFRGILRENERLAEELGEAKSKLKAFTVATDITVAPISTSLWGSGTLTSNVEYLNSKPYAD